MRTQDEIVAELRRLNLKENEFDDVLGFKRDDLAVALDFEHAKEFLVKEVTLEEWTGNGGTQYSTDEAVLCRMHDYMDFAWGKANDCRGLSANRSIMHYEAWLWLLGGEHADFGAKLQENYQFYGKPQLKMICERFGWDWRQWDDGKWRNSESEEGLSPEEALEEMKR